jgi:hypothetical protein
LAAAARAQLDACNTLVPKLNKKLLTKQQWEELHVLVLGPYMAKQGELFLQYFAKILHTHQRGDWRVVYFDGDDLPSAFDRLGTTCSTRWARRQSLASAPGSIAMSWLTRPWSI